MDNKKALSWLITFLYGYSQDYLNELFSSQDNLANYQGNLTRFNKFKKTLNENSIVDIGHIRLPFTGWNSRSNGDAIFERLDRILTNPQWINFYRDAYVKNLSIISFDHSLILLSMNTWHRTS